MVPWRYCLLFLALSCDGDHGIGTNNGTRQQWWGRHGQQCLDIVACSLLARAKALMVAAWMMLHNKDSVQAEEGALAALSPVPCPLLQWRRRQRRKQLCMTTTVAAARMTVPWHCWLFLSCSCSGVDGNNVDDSAQQQWWQSRRWCLGTIVGHPLPACVTARTAAVQKKQWWCGRWCHVGIVSCSMPSHAMMAMAAAQKTECNNNVDGCADNNALALFAIPHPLARWQSRQRQEPQY